MNSVCILLAALAAIVCAQTYGQQQQVAQPTQQFRQYTTANNQYGYQQQPQYNTQQQQQQQYYNQQNQQYQTTQNPYMSSNTQTSNLNRQYDQNGQVFFNSVSPLSFSLALISSAAAMLLL